MMKQDINLHAAQRKLLKAMMINEGDI